MMMFNGLIMCPDSDTSEFTKESGASSLQEAGSCCSWDAGARAAFYHAKLMATLQVLENKEETIRVQGESLRVAEARIATLSARAATLRGELDEKTQELQMLRRAMDKCRIEKTDVSLTTDVQEVLNQKNIVRTLQTNLSVIEDLYRECFYETAKQEELIEMLRQSYLDVRLMDKDKSDQIGRLQNVINSQKWSLERCRDIAIEVEGLKMEISNFLSSSNNDSGMWERSESSRVEEEVAEELQDIAAQLHQLRDMLTGDCTCGLEEENITLKNLNENLQIEVGSLRQRVDELESTLANKVNGDQCCMDKMAEKEQELNSVRRRLAELEERAGVRADSCDALASQLRQAQASIEEQTRELVAAREHCRGHEAAITRLNHELEKANHIIEEGRSLREEVSSMRRAVCDSDRRTRALADELVRAHAHCQSLDAFYMEKAQRADELQAQLEAAHARGAALCAQARHAVCAVQAHLRRMQHTQREQENRIKELETQNKALQQRKQNGIIDLTDDPCCSKCPPRRSKRDRFGTTEIPNSGTSSEFAFETAQLQSKPNTKDMGSCKCTSQIRIRRQGTNSSGNKSVACNGPTPNKQRGIKITGCESSPIIRERRKLRSKTSGTEIDVCNCPLQGKKYEIANAGEREQVSSRRSKSVIKNCECSVESKEDRSRTSESEIATCSSAPTPPRRLLRKKSSSSDEKIQEQESWLWGGWRRRRAASAQAPRRRDAACDCGAGTGSRAHLLAMPREASPCAELEQRMSALFAALEPAQARWAHARTT